MANNFHYCSSWDELAWQIDVALHHFYCFEIKWDQRPMIRDWIAECCKGQVYCWNGTSTPGFGAPVWSYIAPDETKTWLIFTNKEDESLFLLRFNELLQNHFANGVAAWHSSRS